MTKQDKTALAAVFTNIFLTAAKFILAYLSGSLALLAEAFHSFSDIGTSGAVFLAVRSETKKGSAEGVEHVPWWRRNPQQKVAIGIGVFLLVVSILMFTKVFKTGSLGVKYPVPIALGMLVLAFFSFLLSRLELSVGESTGSTALVADGHHARVDMLGSLLVAAALFGESLLWSVDRLAAGIISLFIFVHAMNVFAAVLKEMKRKEAAGEYLFPGWAALFTKENINNVYKRLLGAIAKMRGLSLDDPDYLSQAASTLRRAVLLLLAVAYLASGVFTLKPNEKAVVERFGRPLSGTSINPGIHYRLPWPIDRTRKVDATTVRRLVIGSEISPESKVLLWTNIHYLQEYNVLTGENIFMDIGVTVHYRVKNPYEYLYNVREAEALLKEAAYGIAFEIMATRRFFYVVTEGRNEVEKELREALISALEPFNTGIEIVDVTLRDLHPPTAVAGDFEDVVSATIDHQKYISEAEGYRNDLIPKARGESKSKAIAAEAYKANLELKAVGETSRFLNNLTGYQISPVIMRARLYIETMEQVLSNKEKYIFPADAATSSGVVELYLLDESTRTRMGKGRSSLP